MTYKPAAPVAEVIKSDNGSVWIDWRGKTMADFIGAKFYAAPPAQPSAPPADDEDLEPCTGRWSVWINWRRIRAKAAALKKEQG